MSNQATQKNPLDQVKTDDASIVALVTRIKQHITGLNQTSPTSINLYEAMLTIIKLHSMVAEANQNLDYVYDLFAIEGEERNVDTLLVGAENLMRRAACLSEIEEQYFTTIAPTAEGESAVCPLDWNAQPEEYAQQFGTALETRKEPSPIILLN